MIVGLKFKLLFNAVVRRLQKLLAISSYAIQFCISRHGAKEANVLELLLVWCWVCLFKVLRRKADTLSLIVSYWSSRWRHAGDRARTETMCGPSTLLARAGRLTKKGNNKKLPSNLNSQLRPPKPSTKNRLVIIS